MLRAWERAAKVEGLPPLQRSAARKSMAITYMRVGKPALALKQAEMALVDARDRDCEFDAAVAAQWRRPRRAGRRTRRRRWHF